MFFEHERLFPPSSSYLSSSPSPPRAPTSPPAVIPSPVLTSPLASIHLPIRRPPPVRSAAPIRPEIPVPPPVLIPPPRSRTHIVEPRPPAKEPRRAGREPTREENKKKRTTHSQTFPLNLNLNLNPFSRKSKKSGSKLYLVRKTRSSAERPRSAVSPSPPRTRSRPSVTPPSERPQVIYVPVPTIQVGPGSGPELNTATSPMPNPRDPRIIRTGEHGAPVTGQTTGPPRKTEPLEIRPPQKTESPQTKPPQKIASPPARPPTRENRRQRSRSVSSEEHGYQMKSEERKRLIEEQERRQHAERALREAQEDARKSERGAREAERIAREETRKREDAEQDAKLYRDQRDREVKRNSDLQLEQLRLEMKNRLELESREQLRRRESPERARSVERKRERFAADSALRRSPTQEDRARQEIADEERRRQFAAEHDRLRRARNAGLPREPRHVTVVSHDRPDSPEESDGISQHSQSDDSLAAPRQRATPRHGRTGGFGDRGERVLQQDMRTKQEPPMSRRDSLTKWLRRANTGREGREERERRHSRTEGRWERGRKREKDGDV